MSGAVDAAGPPARGAVRLDDRAATICAICAAVAVPFAAYTGFVLYQFYGKGSFLEDAGWFAYVMSSGHPSLPNPRSLGGGSFFGTHIAPLFCLTGLVRQGLPVSDAQFFAAIIGLGHALPALAVVWVLRAGGSGSGPVGIAIAAAAVAIAFSFNGLALAIARYPHFEILIVGFACLFAAALLRRRLGFASCFFAAALLIREDAGLHLFALLFVLIAVNRWYGIGWREQRAEVIFAIVALLYAAAAVGVGAMLAPAGQSALRRIYVGSPPFAHLTPSLVADRLLGYVAFRTYLVLPMLIAVMWSVRTRNPYLLVGYLAFLPWGLLQLAACSDIAGTLSGYYAYPFLIAAFWPLVGALRSDRKTEGADSRGRPSVRTVLPFVAMVVGSFLCLGAQYNPGKFALAGFLTPPGPARQADTDDAITRLLRAKPALGRILADGSVVALAPNDFAWTETILGRAADSRPNTVLYFVNGYEAPTARRIAAASGLAWHYRVTGTPLRVATDRPIAAIATAPPAAAPIAALLVPADARD